VETFAVLVVFQYFHDMLARNYNNTFEFVKADEILLVFFSGNSVYLSVLALLSVSAPDLVLCTIVL